MNSDIVGISPESCHAGLLPQGKLKWILHTQHMTEITMSNSNRSATNMNSTIMNDNSSISSSHESSSIIIPAMNDVEMGEEHGPDYAPVVVKTKGMHYPRWSRQKEYSTFEGKPEHVLMIGRRWR